MEHSETDFLIYADILQDIYEEKIEANYQKIEPE